MAGRVVQVARDPRPFLGAREAPLALGLPLRLTGLLRGGRDALTSLPHPVAREPGRTPDQGAEEQLRPEAVADERRADEDDQARGEDNRPQPRVASGGRRAAV